MCLGVPGKVIEVERTELGLVRGKVEFGGIVKEVNLSYTPDVEVGEYVVVHVGFSISTLDEGEARQVFRYLEELGALQELETPADGAEETDEIR
jgi:hydrogenase expression/formation protein HypC